MPVPNYLTRTKTTPQKNSFLWSNAYRIEVVKISNRHARVKNIWAHGRIHNII